MSAPISSVGPVCTRRPLRMTLISPQRLRISCASWPLRKVVTLAAFSKTGYRLSCEAPLFRRRDVEAYVFARNIHANVVLTARLNTIPNRQILPSGVIHLITLVD
jgi:hypothetical protein